MRSFPSWMPVRRLLAILLLPAMACSSGGSEQLAEDVQSDGRAVAKGGLDSPAVAVGPFLDSVFPSTTPIAPGTGEWTIVPAFPNLALSNTLAIASNPADDRIYVSSQDGLVVAFDNRSDVSTTETFLDVRDRVTPVQEGGLLALVFHPEFGNVASPHGKSFYVFYTSDCALDSSHDAPDLSNCNRDEALRLSRFEVFDGTVTGDPSTEQVLFSIQLLSVRHLGGGMAFRNDGYLYLTIGDQVRYETAQNIVDNFEGGAHRFAVDVLDNGDGTWTCPAGSHQPRRIYDTINEISGQHYCIPNGNPWLDPTGGVFEEYCAIGLRNPFRLAHDAITGRLWEGDVGETSREEINIIECGNNYGWPFREGLAAGPRSEPASFLGILTDPVIDFPRGEAGAIIGGYVYRGSRLPELYGRYLTGDYVTNRIWAVTLDETTMIATKVELTNFGPGNLATWGQDNTGEVFLGDISSTGPLYTLDRVGDPTPDAPSLLSQTGAFSDMSGAVPSTAWVPYTLNQPFWSDGALKYRFIAVPTDGVRDTAAEQIGFSPTGDWSYPIGTVLMKHFELPLDETDPTSTTRLESRFLVLGADGEWYGLTYRWRPDQMEADLLTTGETGDYAIQLSGGGTRGQTWYFPSRLDCMRCHLQGVGGAAGPRTHQLNGDFSYAGTGRTDNQLRTWNDLGMFSPPIDDASIPTLLSSPALADVTSSLHDRARSWLDANCSYCHRPGGADAGFDARFTTPFVDQGFVGTPVRDDLGNPGTVVIYPGDRSLSALWQRAAAVGPIAMPPLAKALPEDPAVELLGEWIDRLKPIGTPNTPPALTNPGDQSHQPGEAVALALGARDDDGDALYFDAVGLPDGLALDHDSGAVSGTLTSSGVWVITASASDGSSVSVVNFEWNVNATPCGDGVLDTGEECDDGNLDDGDGCTSGCVVEFCGDGVINNDGAETCDPPGTEACTDTCTARTAKCGDGFLTPPEECEDGNVVDGDGCTSGCVVEFCGDGVVNNDGSETCEPPSTALCTDLCVVRTPLCGDGFQTLPEECEDGNLVSGDGCTSGCVVEFCGDCVVNNDGAETCEPPSTATCSDTCAARQAVCGDGIQTPPEQCEDGNLVNGDGCTSGCLVEFCGDGVVNNSGAEACEPPGTALCTGTCTVRVALCGDGFQTPPEQCEDGNLVSGDGCASGCLVEFCGDGLINNSGAEDCEPPGTATCTDSCAARQAVCGDGFQTPPEQCEDGNLVNGDGCTSGCLVEFCGDGIVNNSGAEDCEPPGTALCTNSCAARETVCGDGFQTPPEQCEDGNLVNGDGCTSGCTLEFCGDGVVNDNGTEACEPPGTATCTEACAVRTGVCGDGFLTPPEQCEDGNLIDGDGCSSACVVEVPPTCGDGNTDPGEECDDANLLDADGCTSSCMLELCGDGVVNNNGAEACEPPNTALCADNCAVRAALCGDGFRTPPEECEDSNSADGDGCTSSCTVEFCGDGIVNDNGVEACEPPGTTLCTDTCTLRVPQCGDGLLTPPEQCEDGNLVDSDGCTSSCMVEFCGDGAVNNNGAEDCEPPGTPVCTDTCAARGAVCGDGFINVPEECEDGNVLDGDGCTSTCMVEFCGDGVVNDNGTEACEPPGTALCTDACAVRLAFCGDGFRTPPEMCEDGNLVSGDGCTSACAVEFCGDGVVNNNGTEACEPPGTATCTEACTVRTAACGDGFITSPEECEDGNVLDGDGCSSDCMVEGGPFCGDGAVDDGEECDDGNARDGDGCSTACEFEVPPVPDVGTPVPDGGTSMPDGGVPDAGTPVEPDPDVGTSGASPTGGCRVQRNGAPIDFSVLIGLFAVLCVRRRHPRCSPRFP
ncbi:MAG: DUF4215 domain-containing protein [Polyangiales bacterium]